MIGGKRLLITTLLAILTDHAELLAVFLLGMLMAFFIVFMIIKKIVRAAIAFPSRIFGEKRA